MGWAMVTAQTVAVPQTLPPSATIQDVTRSLGPFALQAKRFTVLLHEKHIVGATVADPDWQTTLAAIEIKDERGVVHYQTKAGLARHL